MSYALEPRAVERNKRIDSCFEFAAIEEITHSSKIAFAFFAYSRDKINRTLRQNIAGVQRARESDKADDPARVIADARRATPYSVASYADIRPRRKNRVKMRRFDDTWVPCDTRALGSLISF